MTNLKILLTVIGTLGVYTFMANIIPQVESAVAEKIVLTADTSPEELVAIGEELFAGAGGCTACHGLGTRAPDLVGVAGTVCATRVPGKDCKAYLWESLTDPTAYIVDGFQPIMLDQRLLLDEPQLWTLVAFLQDQGGTVTVTADDFATTLSVDEEAASPAPTGDGDPAVAAGATGVSPTALIESYGCLACHSLAGTGAQIGPPFEDLRGKDADYIRRGIVEPNADTAQGFEAFAGTMPPMFGTLMSAEELDALIGFLKGDGEDDGQ